LSAKADQTPLSIDHDRRHAERTPILGALHGDIMVFQSMSIAEIGLAGVTIDTSFPLHLDSIHDLRLTLGGSPIIVKGRVIHSHISDVEQDILMYRSGIEFVEMPEDVQAAIAQFVDGLQAGRG